MHPLNGITLYSMFSIHATEKAVIHSSLLFFFLHRVFPVWLVLLACQVAVVSLAHLVQLVLPVLEDLL